MMELLLMVLMCCLVFFIYRQGIKDGIAFKKDRELESLNPVVKHKERQEQSSQTLEMLKFNAELENLMSYDGSVQKKAVSDFE